jgi:N6-L-threonylcarbamoyladenine synthase
VKILLNNQSINIALMLILGIESSCDDSCAAIINSQNVILANVVNSQNAEHQLFQGIVPEIAARCHIKNLHHVVNIAIQEARIELTAIDAIAATSGPGLIGSLIVGSMFGKALAHVLKKPFIAINHLEGHALTIRLSHGIAYPYLLLLLSGGHCQFVAILELGKYKILGGTLDDAVGEAFDKVAKMLNLSFPGGPEIEKRALIGNKYKYDLPKPIINRPDCNMSFSGLKTAVRILITKLGNLTDQNINDVAASFQYIVGMILSSKMARAIDAYKAYEQNNKTIVIAGGVASNKYLRNLLQITAAQHGYDLIAPPIALCTDNAAMIAFVGLERLRAGLATDIDYKIRARWSLEEL